jgi:WD40 repeat protein
MVVSSDHNILAVNAQNGLTVLDASRRRRIFYRTAHEPELGYLGVALSPDGKILAFSKWPSPTCGCKNGYRVFLWDLAAGRAIKTIDTNGLVEAMALSTDGKSLATLNSNGKIRLWAISTGRQIGHGQAIPVGAFSDLMSSDFTFSPDSSLLATAQGDGTARLWDVATQQQVGPTMNASTTGEVHAVAFTPDTKLLITLGHDSTVRLWDVAFPTRLQGAMCSIAAHPLTRSEWAVYIPSEPYQKSC